MRAAQAPKVAGLAIIAAILTALAGAAPAGAAAADCFLAPNGSVVDVCDGKPCHTDAYTR